MSGNQVTEKVQNESLGQGYSLAHSPIYKHPKIEPPNPSVGQQVQEMSRVREVGVNVRRPVGEQEVDVIEARDIRYCRCIVPSRFWAGFPMNLAVNIESVVKRGRRMNKLRSKHGENRSEGRTVVSPVDNGLLRPRIVTITRTCQLLYALLFTRCEMGRNLTAIAIARE